MTTRHTLSLESDHDDNHINVILWGIKFMTAPHKCKYHMFFRCVVRFEICAQNEVSLRKSRHIEKIDEAGVEFKVKFKYFKAIRF